MRKTSQAHQEQGHQYGLVEHNTTKETDEESSRILIANGELDFEGSLPVGR